MALLNDFPPVGGYATPGTALDPDDALAGVECNNIDESEQILPDAVRTDEHVEPLYNPAEPAVVLHRLDRALGGGHLSNQSKARAIFSIEFFEIRSRKPLTDDTAKCSAKSSAKISAKSSAKSRIHGGPTASPCGPHAARPSGGRLDKHHTRRFRGIPTHGFP